MSELTQNETRSPELGFIGPLADTFTVQTMVSMVMFGVGMLAGLITGALADRLVAIRISQMAMVLAFFGVIALTLPTPLAAIATALLLGLSYGPVNSASTQILARVITTRSRPFIFSIKHTGMPAGAAQAGAFLPLLILAFDWRIAITATGVLAVVVALGIQKLQTRIDASLSFSAERTYR